MTGSEGQLLQNTRDWILEWTYVYWSLVRHRGRVRLVTSEKLETVAELGAYGSGVEAGKLDGQLCDGRKREQLWWVTLMIREMETGEFRQKPPDREKSKA